MKVGQKLYVRTDRKVEGKKTGPNDFDDHIAYLKDVASKRLFMGGGFVKADGGMIVYEAKDLEDAKKVADGDPLIARGLYIYDLKEWELVLLSDNL